MKSPGFYIIILFYFFPVLYGQDSIFTKQVNIQINQQTVYYTLTEIEKQVGYFFSYNSEIINEDKIITLQLDNYPLKNTLDTLLLDSTLIYKIVGDQIVINRDSLYIENDTSVRAEIFFLTINGIVLDGVSLNEIPYATVSIEGRNVGTVTNSQGSFVLKIPAKLTDENLVISYLGYKKLRVKIGDIRDRKKFRLIPVFIPIPEVIIRLNEPVSILTQAIEKIPENYFHTQVFMDAFYRETIRKNDAYTAVSEALISIIKSPYNDSKSDQVKIEKGRKYYDRNGTDTVTFKLKAGLQNITFLDIIKERPNFLTPEYFPDYAYYMENVIMIDDEPAYNIAFEPIRNRDVPLFKGNIFIDIRTMAIKRAEFAVSENSLNIMTNLLVQKKPIGMKVITLDANYLVNYKSAGKKLFISYLKSKVEFKLRKRHKIFGNIYTLSSETAVTDLDTINIPRLRSRETSNIKDVFETQIPDYNTQYWEDFNIIQPEQPLIEAIGRLTGSLLKEE